MICRIICIYLSEFGLISTPVLYNPSCLLNSKQTLSFIKKQFFNIKHSFPFRVNKFNDMFFGIGCSIISTSGLLYVT